MCAAACFRRAVLSATVIGKIHSLVLMDRPEDGGVYCTIPVSITGADPELPPHLVPAGMERLLREQAEDRRRPVVKAACFHLSPI